jgi:hypothetical protein
MWAVYPKHTTAVATIAARKMEVSPNCCYCPPPSGASNWGSTLLLLSAQMLSALSNVAATTTLSKQHLPQQHRL